MPRLNATHIFIRSGVILGCLFLGAAYTSAQTSGIMGKVTDIAGNVVVGADIKTSILSPDRAATPRIFRAVSNLEGEFTIPALPIGSYEIEVTAPYVQVQGRRVYLAVCSTLESNQ